MFIQFGMVKYPENYVEEISPPFGTELIPMIFHNLEHHS